MSDQNPAGTAGAQRWTAQFYFEKYGLKLRDPSYWGPHRNSKLMVIFVQTIRANPSISRRFIRKGQRRQFYDTSDGKKPLIRFCEINNLCHFFNYGGDPSEMPGLPPKLESFESDFFLNDGCLLAVTLLHPNGKLGAIFVDLDEAQIKNGALPRVLDVLDRASFRYLLEISSSGTGCHVWIPLDGLVPAAKAVAWLKRVLDDGGLRKKTKQSPNDYDEIKPTGGSGGVVIVPHFFDNGTSRLARMHAGKLVVLNDQEAQETMLAFEQRPGFLDVIVATEPRSDDFTTEKSASPNCDVEDVDWGGVCGFIKLDDREAERELDRLNICVKRNSRLQEMVATAASTERGGRSEAAWPFFHNMIIDHGFHPQTVVAYCARWPRYANRSAASELLRLFGNTNIKQFLERTSGWRRSIIRHVSKIMGEGTTTPADTVVVLGVDRLARAKQEVDNGIIRKRLIIFDLAPGSFKTTVAIPAIALASAYQYSGHNETFATILHERREDVLRSKKWLEMIPRTVACA